jgi:hypothetical protein
MATAKRGTESTREVQAELRAFALVLSAIRARLLDLTPIIERQPGYRDNERASIAGDDDRHTVEWSIHGALSNDGEALDDVVRHLREEGELTEAAAARKEAQARKDRVVRTRRYEREAAIQEKARQKNAATVASINASVERTTTTLRKVTEVLRRARKNGTRRAAACARS